MQLAHVFEACADVDAHDDEYLRIMILGNCRSRLMAAQSRSHTAHSDLDAYWMPFTANRQFKAQTAPAGARRRACTTRRPEGRKILDGVAGLWCVNAGHGRQEITEAVARAARGHGLRAAVPDGPSGRVRARECRGAHRADRARPRVLHQLRLGVGRHGAQDRAGLSPRQRRCGARAVVRPRARLSRRGLRRHQRRRHGGQSQGLAGRR